MQGRRRKKEREMNRVLSLSIRVDEFRVEVEGQRLHVHMVAKLTKEMQDKWAFDFIPICPPLLT